MTHLKKEIKTNVRKRAHWTCAGCGTKFAPKNHDLLTVHHTIKPINGEHLIPLCHDCHVKAEKEEQKLKGSKSR